MPYTMDGYMLEATDDERRRMQDASVDVVAEIHRTPVGDDTAFLEYDQPGDTALRRHFAHWKGYTRWVAAGRDIPLLTIGRQVPGHDEGRPAVWVDGNMHASEVCGSSVALAIAEDLIQLHAGAVTVGGKPFPAHMIEVLKDTLFYVVPRISPDGAEAVLKQGRYLRSSPVNDRVNQSHAHWVAGDVNGDGLAGYMRQEDPHGELVELRDEQGQVLQPPVMTARMPEDPGHLPPPALRLECAIRSRSPSASRRRRRPAR
jgi:hypothetical protein